MATVSDVAQAAPIGFIVGVVVGFILSDRFRIVRRNGGDIDRDKVQGHNREP